jgi:hypothetical protein
MSALFDSNSAYGQPAMTSVRPSLVGQAAKARWGRLYDSNRPRIGSPLQYE